jgi:cytochrome oxidase assembly protein ShyY1
VLSHVLVLALIVAMVNLGLWQLRRLDERRDTNARIEARATEPVAPLAEVVGPSDGPAQVERARDRTVTASGRYARGEDVLVRNRSLDGQSGSWVVTPLVLEDGSAVIVSRGWVPVTGEQSLPDEAAAPTGPVEVTGQVQPTQERGRFGPVDPAEGRLERISRVDVARLGDQVDPALYPVWIQLAEQAPASGDLPAPVPPADRGDGPHLGYAVQWFVFSLIALIGYPLVLRRVAHREMESVPDG